MIDVSKLAPSALGVLQAIAKHGSLTEAARTCGISQPAASKAIARMETETGLSLIRRDHRPLTLTEEGCILADFARQQDSAAKATSRKLTDCRTLGSGLVRIASFGASASTHILPDLITKARRARPMMQIEISENTDYPSLKAIEEGSADFAITAEDQTIDLDRVPLAKDRLVALVQTGDPLATTRTIDAATLANRDFIMTKGGSEPLVRRWFAGAGLSPAITHNIQQLTSILAMVQAGMGVSMIAEMAVPAHHDGVAVLSLMPEMPRTIYLARKKGSFASRAAELFWASATNAS